jgi:hypothetical protein
VIILNLFFQWIHPRTPSGSGRASATSPFKSAAQLTWCQSYNTFFFVTDKKAKFVVGQIFDLELILFLKMYLESISSIWHHDIQHNGIKHNDIQHIDIQHNLKNAILSMKTVSIMTEYCYAEFRYVCPSSSTLQ